MNINKTIERAKAILFTPKTEWPVVADEPATVADIYKGYVALIAAIPAICMVLSSALYGVFGFGYGLRIAVATYIGALISVYVTAWVVNALADTFGAQKDMVQAFKVVAYASTAAWVAGIAYLAPLLIVLLTVIGVGYSVYLLFLGLPHTMKVPQERAVPYTVVAIVVAIVANAVVGALGRRLFG